MRDADDRRNASIITQSSMMFASTGEQVGWTMNTSAPRMFSSIWNETSLSGNRCSRAAPTGCPEALGNFACQRRMRAPREQFQRTVSHAVSAVRADVRNVRGRGGWGGRIRTFEYGIQSPAPYRLATPQHRVDLTAPPPEGAPEPPPPGPAASGPQTPESITGPSDARLPPGQRPGQRHEPVRPLEPPRGPPSHRSRETDRTRPTRCPVMAAPRAPSLHDRPHHLVDRRMPPRPQGPADRSSRLTGPVAQPRSTRTRPGRPPGRWPQPAPGPRRATGRRRPSPRRTTA